jgi:hypothetical protein
MLLQTDIVMRLSRRIGLAALILASIAPFAGAQGISGLGGSGGAGGGLNSTGGGGAGGGGTSSSTTGGTGGIGTAQTIGSGNLSAFKNGSTGGLSSLSSTTTTATGTSGTTSIPVASDPFSTFYVNPYSTGLIGTTTNSSNTFGQPIYPVPALPTVTAANTATITTSKAGAATGYTSVGARRTPAYITAASETLPLVRHDPAKLQFELQQILARSSVLKSKDRIRVEIMDGAVARLTGIVASAHDQRIAEGLVRLTPGVQNVKNDLQVINQVNSQTN